MCYQEGVVTTFGETTDTIFVTGSDAPGNNAPNKDFTLTDAQERQSKAMSALYEQEASNYSADAWKYVNWYFSNDLTPTYAKASLLRNMGQGGVIGNLTTAAAAALYRNDPEVLEAQEIIQKVENSYTSYATNAEIFDSLKFQIDTNSDGTHTVKLVGLDEAIEALQKADNANGTVTINGQTYTIEQAIQGVNVQVECVNGEATVNAEFDANIKLGGLYVRQYAFSSGQAVAGQGLVFMNEIEVPIHGWAQKTVPCSDVPPEPESPISIGTTATEKGSGAKS
ncbi:MAG: hypothetical protein Q3976_09405, partial [Corynebacterium sp.]|nr:hypothetical protein [Corynebacterium sp.]